MLDNFWDVVSDLQKDVDHRVREFQRAVYVECAECILKIAGCMVSATEIPY